jgi:hypothetical protein
VVLEINSNTIGHAWFIAFVQPEPGTLSRADATAAPCPWRLPAYVRR